MIIISSSIIIIVIIHSFIHKFIFYVKYHVFLYSLVFAPSNNPNRSLEISNFQ